MGGGDGRRGNEMLRVLVSVVVVWQGVGVDVGRGSGGVVCCIGVWLGCQATIWGPVREAV